MREVIRKLNDAEWATIAPLIVRRQQLEARLRDTNEAITRLVAMANRGDGNCQLEVGTRELVATTVTDNVTDPKE